MVWQISAFSNLLINIRVLCRDVFFSLILFTVYAAETRTDRAKFTSSSASALGCYAVLYSGSTQVNQVTNAFNNLRY